MTDVTEADGTIVNRVQGDPKVNPTRTLTIPTGLQAALSGAAEQVSK